MSSKQKKRQPIGQWLPSDRSVTDKWLAGLLKDLKTKHKAKYDLMMKLHPPAEDENTAMKGHPHTCCPDIDPSELGLHPPVEALMNAILTDPGNTAY
jgi:hypothetical protein